MLSKDDVDKMVRDAQEHAEEDRKRREEVETRNEADQLAFQAERTLRDLGDKVSCRGQGRRRRQDHRRCAKRSRATTSTRSARTMSELAESLQRVVTAAYQAVRSRQAATDGAGPSPATARAPVASRRGRGRCCRRR